MELLQRARASGIARMLHRVRSPLAPAPRSEVAPVATPPRADVLEMLRRLGAAMCDGGDDTGDIVEHLDAIAKAYDAHQVSFFALPTGVFVRVDLGDGARADFAPSTGRELRLDQIGALYELVRHAEERTLSPDAVILRLDEILAAPPRLGRAWRVAGLVVLTLGLGLILNPSVQAMPAYVVLALVVAAVQALAERIPTLELVLPVAAAFVVTFASFELAGPLFDEDPRKVLIPPLVTFLPGAALTIGTVELASGSMISGSSRLMHGLTRLLLLAFGISGGAAAAGTFELPSQAPDQLGAWAGWLGVAVFGIGYFVTSPAPRRSLPWVLLALYAAFCAQVAGDAVWGAVASGFTGAIVVPPIARWVETRRAGTPALVTFLPAFWMLVPGALGLTAVTEIVGVGATAGIGDFGDAIVTVVAVALGVLVGSSLYPRRRRTSSRAV